MRKKSAVLIPIFIFLLAGAVIATQAKAETVKYTITNYLTKFEVIPVPDEKGHMIMIGERRGIAVFEDGSVASYHGQLLADAVKGKTGTWQGYGEFTFKDGSKTMTKFQGTMDTKGLEGTGEYVMGTGRFEGIEGTNTIKGKYITRYGKETKGDMLLEVTATYTLPSK